MQTQTTTNIEQALPLADAITQLIASYDADAQESNNLVDELEKSEQENTFLKLQLDNMKKRLDEVIEEKTDLAFMTVGLGVGNTQVFGKNSLSVNASYINLAPYQSAFPDRNKWNKPVQALSGEAVYRFKFKNESLII